MRTSSRPHPAWLAAALAITLCENGSAQTDLGADIARYTIGSGTAIGHAVIARPEGYWVSVSMRTGSGTDIALSELDGNLDVQGSTGLSGTGEDIPEDLKPTSDGGAIMAGSTTSFSSAGLDGQNAFLVKFNAARAVEWARQYGGPGIDHANRVVELPDGGYLMVGNTSDQGAGGKDAWLVRTDPDGELIWSRTYGGPQDDIGNDVLFDENGTIALIGTTWNIAEGNTILLVQTDGSGEPLRIRSIDLQGPDPWPVHARRGSVITARTEGGYYLGGTIGGEWLGASLASDAFVLRIDTAASSIEWCRSFHFNTGHTYMNRLWRVGTRLEAALEMGAGFGAMMRASLLGQRQWSRYLNLHEPSGTCRTLGATPTTEGGFVASGYQVFAGDTMLLLVHGRTSGDLCYQGDIELSFTGSDPNEMVISPLGLTSSAAGTSTTIAFTGTDQSPALAASCVTLSAPEPEAAAVPLLRPTLTDRLDALRLDPTIAGRVALLDARGRLLMTGVARADGSIGWDGMLQPADGLYLLRVVSRDGGISDARFVIGR